ncbi:formyltransferase family protein [Streptomyces niger]|uniref:formyltransferase family protein n=1 Tax=Streptomyces niger TaxID=66373 RepID=UPI0006992D49|nr:formyltransferase family protein [Streptomyces niger]
MRILVCAQRDLVVCVAMNRLLRQLTAHTVEVAMVTMRPGRYRAEDSLERQRWFERDLPNSGIFPTLDLAPRPSGELLTFQHLSREFEVPFHDIKRINTGDGLDLVQRFQPELIISLRFGLIFKQPVLSVPPLGIINAHSGSLPEHPGVAAPVHTLLAGETKLTSTLHMIDEGIDSGPIIGKSELPFDSTRSLFWHLPKLFELGVDMYLRTLPDLMSGRITAQPQDTAPGCYHPEPAPGELDDTFKQRGLRFFDERDFAEVIGRFGADWSPRTRRTLLRAYQT